MKKILVTDDDIHIGNLLEDALTREGYAVIRAYSGTEAQLILSKEKPDLILLDLMLPGLSGEALLPQIKDIPVIIVSAKADTADKVGLSIARSLVEKMNGTISAGYSENVLSISIVFPE